MKNNFNNVIVRYQETVDQKFEINNDFELYSIKYNSFINNTLCLNIQKYLAYFKISGIPKKAYDGEIIFIFVLKINNIKYNYYFKKGFYLAPDPKSLWKNLDVIDFEGYVHPNEEAKSLDISKIEKTIIAASIRGRFHAHVGKPRDDSFFFDHDEESGCTFVAVADGAGSVRFSRQGSTIACQYASEMAKNYLTNKAIVDRSAKTS